MTQDERNAVIEECAKACQAQESGEHSEYGAGIDDGVGRCFNAVLALKGRRSLAVPIADEIAIAALLRQNDPAMLRETMNAMSRRLNQLLAANIALKTTRNTPDSP